MEPLAQPLPALECPVCGLANQCAAAAAGRFDVDCWCTQVTISPVALARVPAQARDRACLCPGCAALASRQPDDDSG